MAGEIFRSDDLVVRFEPGSLQQHCVVTFDSYTDVRSLDRPGFGEAFFRSRNIAAIHVLSRDNDWYQYNEMMDALAAIRFAVADYDRVMTYGSSMGAYAALKFADVIGAKAVLALSPQYSLDPLKVAFENRWIQDARRIAWIPEIDDMPFSKIEDIIIAYDPNNIDNLHVKLIADQIKFRSIKLPNAGHPVTSFLNECGLLSKTVIQHLEGGIDPHFVEVTSKRSRFKSASYLLGLAERQPAGRARLALRLCEASTAAEPPLASAFARLGQKYSAAGRHEEAIAAHEKALSLSDRAPAFLHHYSCALFAAGHREKAYLVANNALEIMPLVSVHHHWMAHMLVQDFRLDDAEFFSSRSVELEPTNELYAATLDHIRKFKEVRAKKVPFQPPSSSPLTLRKWIRGWINKNNAQN